MKAKKVCYIEANQDGTVGGSHYCLLDLLRHLDSSRFAAHCVFYHEHPLIDAFKEVSEVSVLAKPSGLRIPGRLGANPLVRAFQRSVNAVVFRPLEWFKVRRCLRRIAPDILHLNNSPTAWAWIANARSMQIPVVSHIRGCWTLTNRHKQLARNCERLIAISDFIARDVQRQTGQLNHITTMLDGIDVAQFLSAKRRTREEVLHSLDLPQDCALIGIVGNIKRWKGQHIFLKALEQLVRDDDRIRGVVVGGVSSIADDNLYHSEVLLLAASDALSPKVRFTGFTQDVSSLMDAMDIFVHASTEPEPLGRVIVEAQLLGKPVVASAHGGPLELVTDGVNGFLVPPSNSVCLAEALEKLLASEDLRRNIGNTAAESAAEKYDIRSYAAKIMRLYDELD